MSSQESSDRAGLTTEAIAHFVEAIALLLFAALWGVAAVLVANFLTDVTEFALFAGGVGALILAIMAISAYVDGSRVLKARDSK